MPGVHSKPTGDERPQTWKNVDSSMWCVTRQDLKDLRDELKNAILEGTLRPPAEGDPFYNAEYDGVDIEDWDPTVYKIMDDFIKPGLLELSSRTSWALNRHAGGKICKVFATHAWSEGIFEFIDSALHSFPWREENMYVCFLSNPQDEGSLKELLTNDPEKSPFAKALALASWFVVIPNRRVCIYERLWCVYEMFLAQKRVHAQGNLKVRLRSLKVNKKVIKMLLCRLLVIPAPGFLLAIFVLAPRIGHLLGPLMWMLFFYLVGAAFRVVVHILSELCLTHQHPHDVPTCELQLMQLSSYGRLALAGVGGGLALFDLIEHYLMKHHENLFHMRWQKADETSFLHMRWAQGEEMPCILVFLTFTFKLAYDMTMLMKCEVIHEQGGKLDRFETVLNAECFSEEDKHRIQEAIQDDIDEINEAIGDLRVLGKYDAETLYNLRLGMPATFIRNGVNPFAILCGLCAWEFWWMVDLNAIGLRSCSVIMLVLSSIAAMFVVYGSSSLEFHTLVPNEKYMFAITSSMWLGVIFAIISNSNFFFRRLAVEHHRMTISTLPLWLAMMCVLFLVNGLFYSGLLAACRRSIRGPSFHDLVSMKDKLEARYNEVSDNTMSDEEFSTG